MPCRFEAPAHRSGIGRPRAEPRRSVARGRFRRFAVHRAQAPAGGSGAAALLSPLRRTLSAGRRLGRSHLPARDELLVAPLGLSCDLALLGAELLEVVGVGRTTPVAFLLRQP